jgi:hypothetical protein
MISLFVLLFLFSVADAQTEPPQFMTVDGRLYDSSNTTNPLLDASVLLKIQVLNPAKTCILYEEEQTVSTLSSNGYFNVRVGSPTSDPKRSTDDSNNSMMQVFQNQNASIAGRNSSGSGVPCSYTPANGDSRFFRFIVTPSSTGVTSQLSPDMTIDSVPQALVAESLQGLSPDSFIQVNANTTQAKADNIFGAGYAALTNLISGTSSLYLQNTVNGTVIPNRATDPGSPTAGQIWYDSVANALKYYNGSTVQILSTGVSADPTKLPLTGGAMTGNINMGGNQILGVGHITQNPQSTITLGAYTTAQQGTLTAALTAANKGATWFNSDTNKMMYWDGTVAQVVLDVATAGTVGDITAVTAGTGLTGGGVTGAVTLNVDIGMGATQLFTNNAVDSCPAGQMLQMSPGPIYDWSCIAINDSSKLALAGGTMTGNITMGGNQILGAGHIVQANQSSITIGSYTTAQETPFVAALNAGNEGTLWFNSDTNELKYWDGAAAQVLTSLTSAGDITAVNTNAGSGLSGGAASGAATLQIVVDNTGIEINGTNQLQLKDAGVVTAKLADNAITAVKVANNAITSAKILDDEITNADINASAAIAWSKIDKTGAVAGDVNAVARAGDTMTGSLNIDNEQELRLSEADVNGANYVALKAPATVATNYTLTLPDTAGANGQVLSTNGSGVLSWITPSAVPANNSLNFSHFVDAMSLDTSTEIATGAHVLSVTNDGTGNTFVVNDNGSADTSPFVIDSEGRVGIGTVVPASKLQLLDGVFELNAGSSDFSVSHYSAGGYPSFDMYRSRGTQTAPYTPITSGDTIGTLKWWGSTNSNWQDAAQIKIDAVGGGGWTAGVSRLADMSFYTSNGFGNFGERMRIQHDGNVGIGTAAPATKLDVEGTIQISDGGELCAAPANAGMVRYNAGTIQYCNGSAWQTLGVSGAGLTTFNSQTGSTQTLDVGSTGLAPNWNSASNVHTLNIPLASGAGVTSGTISKTDYDAFNAKVSATRAVSTLAGSGLTGGGDLSVDRNLAVNITGTSAIGGAIDNADEILIYDISTTSLRKVARSNFVLDESEVDAFVANNGYALATNYVAKAGDTMTGRLVMDPKGVAAGDGGSVVFTELAANGTAQVGLRAPDDVTTGVVWTLPAADGTSGQLLQTNGAGILSWVNPSTVPSANSLNFSHFVDAMTLDASTDISVGTNVLSITNDGSGNSFVVNDNGAADSSPFVINASGNVGVGTTSASEKIEINMGNLKVTTGTVIVSGTSPYVMLTDKLTDANAAISGGPASSDVFLIGKTSAGKDFVGSHGSGSGGYKGFFDLGSYAGFFGFSYNLANPMAGSQSGIHVNDDDVRLYAGGNEVFHSSSSGQSYLKDSEVSIGTMTPTAKLHQDSGTATSTFHKFTVGTTTGQLTTDGFDIGADASGNVELRQRENLEMRFFTNNARVMTIQNSGNIGVGTSSPTTRVDVSGAITSRPSGTGSGQTGQIIMRELAVGGTETATIRAPDAIGSSYALTLPTTAGSANQVLTTDGTGILSWTTPAGGGGTLSSLTAATATNTIANTNFAQTWNWDTLSTQTAMSLGTNSATSGTLLDLTNSFNNATATGNVLKLNATGASNASVPLMITNAGTGNSLRVNDDGTDTDTSPFVINASGNVGIGTTTPGQPLTVNGRIETRGGMLFNQGSSPTDNLIYVGSTSAGSVDASFGFFVAGVGSAGATHGAYFLGRGNDYSGSTNQRGNLYFSAGEPTAGVQDSENSINFLTGSDINRMIINRYGNVGIGTVLPTTILDVAGAITSRPSGTGTGQTGQIIMRELATSPGGSDSVTLRAPDSVGTSFALTLPGTAGSSGQVLQTNGSGILSWATVGTGDFMANGSVAMTGPLVLPSSNDATTPELTFNGDLNTGIYQPAADNIAFSTGGVKRMDILPSGNVGIGENSSDTYELEIRKTDEDVDAFVQLRAPTTTRQARIGTLVYNNGTASAPHLQGSNFGGTSAAPTAVTSNTTLLDIIAYGGRGGYNANTGAKITAVAEETFSVSAAGSSLRFSTSAIGESSTSERMRIHSNGFVGIGTTAPRANLEVNGSIISKPAVDNLAATTINFANGNLQYTTLNCQAFALHNLKDGGTYMFSVQGTTSATCSFTGFSDAGSTALTVLMPPDHGATTASKHTIYNFAVMGNFVYVSWTPGY